MAGHLAALIPGDRLKQHCRQPGQLAQQPVAQLKRVGPGQVDQFDEATLTLDQCADRRPMLRTDDDVALPMPSLRTILGRERTLVHAEHRLGEAPPAPGEAQVRAAVITAGAQR